MDEERLQNSIERIGTAIQLLNDRQRVQTQSTTVLFHGMLPPTLEEAYIATNSVSASACEMRFVNLGDTPASVEVYIIDWRQITKNSGGTFLADPDSAEFATAVASDVVLCITLEPKGHPEQLDHYIESCCYNIPTRWQLRLKSSGNVAGHISGVELITL